MRNNITIDNIAQETEECKTLKELFDALPEPLLKHAPRNLTPVDIEPLLILLEGERKPCIKCAQCCNNQPCGLAPIINGKCTALENNLCRLIIEQDPEAMRIHKTYKGCHLNRK